MSARLSPAPLRVVRVILAALPLILVTAFVIIVRPDLASLAGYGYLGVFLLMLLSSATVLMPMPGLATVAAAGILWNPFLVGLAGGLGGASGELFGYLAGYGARDIIASHHNRWLDMIKQFVGKYGFFAILLLASIPNPFFDVVGIAAGSLGYPGWRFFIAVALGNTIKCTSIALAGGAISLVFLGL
jgi:uncharacterized membrane protein YdjX (TVP38/TMEM64 family)